MGNPAPLIPDARHHGPTHAHTVRHGHSHDSYHSHDSHAGHQGAGAPSWEDACDSRVDQGAVSTPISETATKGLPVASERTVRRK